MWCHSFQEFVSPVSPMSQSSILLLGDIKVT